MDDGQIIRIYDPKELLELGVGTARNKEYKQVEGSEQNVLLYLHKSGQLDIKKLTGFHKTLQGIDSIGDVTSGDFVVYSQGKAALIGVNRLDSMTVLIPYRYHDLYIENYDVYVARKRTKWGLVDTTNRLVLPLVSESCPVVVSYKPRVYRIVCRGKELYYNVETKQFTKPEKKERSME